MEVDQRRHVLAVIGQLGQLRDSLRAGRPAALPTMLQVAHDEITWLEAQPATMDRSGDDPLLTFLWCLCGLESVLRRTAADLSARSAARDRLGSFLLDTLERLRGAFLPGLEQTN